MAEEGTDVQTDEKRRNSEFQILKKAKMRACGVFCVVVMRAKLLTTLITYL